MFYTTADGTKVYNKGEKQLEVCTLVGRHQRKMTFQVAQAWKALGSVNQLVCNGNRLLFDQDHQGKDVAHIQNRTSGQKIWMRVENGVYVLDLMVGPTGKGEALEVFGRQG